MKLSKNISKAINLASLLHSGQTRKGKLGIPYISHPYSVAWILSNYSDDEDVIIAGLLHDVLEDVKGYRHNDLVRDFGDRVAHIVKGVSEDKDPNKDDDQMMPWEQRKLKYLAALEIGSKESLLVCTADKIHNLQSMMELYKECGDKIWSQFKSPSGKKLWLYREVLSIVKERLDSEIVAELENVYIKAEKILL